MQPEQVKKVNDLARSLRENRLAANIEEAIEMAKRMLLNEGEGEKHSEEQIKTQERLQELVDDHEDVQSKKLIKEAHQAEVESEDSFKDEEELKHLKAELVRETRELEDLKEDIEALREIIKDAPEAEKHIKEEIEKEELAEKRAEPRD